MAISKKCLKNRNFKARNVKAGIVVHSLNHPILAPHIASPHVVVDDRKQELIMFYHGLEGSPTSDTQISRYAVSKDGISWRSNPVPVGQPQSL